MVGETDLRQSEPDCVRGVLGRFAHSVAAERRVHVVISGQWHERTLKEPRLERQTNLSAVLELNTRAADADVLGVNPAQFNPRLESVRGLAALMVAVGHAFAVYPSTAAKPLLWIFNGDAAGDVVLCSERVGAWNGSATRG
jgi:hypothetical protein